METSPRNRFGLRPLRYNEAIVIYMDTETAWFAVDHLALFCDATSAEVQDCLRQLAAAGRLKRAEMVALLPDMGLGAGRDPVEFYSVAVLEMLCRHFQVPADFQLLSLLAAIKPQSRQGVTESRN